MRKHAQPATVKFTSRITVCFWVHNNHFRVFFWQQTHFKSHWQGNSKVFFKTQWKVMGIHILCHRVLFEVMCILSVPTTAVQRTLELVWPLLLWGEMQESVQVKEVATAKKCPIPNYAPLAVCNDHWKPTTTICLQQLETTGPGDRNRPYVHVCTLSPSVQHFFSFAVICLWPKPKRTISE